jgi:hypothetical protein
MKFTTARRVLVFLSLVAVLAPPATCQITNVYLPDANPATGVICNAIPFSSVFGANPGAWSHLTIVPASQLFAQGVLPGHRLVDIRFAPCGSGTIHMPNAQVIVGHLVSPLPTFSLANGFADQTLVYDSTVSGPLDYACTANTWSSLAVGGGSLAWDGFSDVGIFTTHAGLTITSTTGWQGSFWREASLMRHYVNAYQATIALTSSLSGLKMSLVFADPVSLPALAIHYGQGSAGSAGIPAFAVPELPFFGNPAFGLGLQQAHPASTAVLIVSSASSESQIGVGSDVRLLVDVSSSAASLLITMPVTAAGGAFLPAPVPVFASGLVNFTVYCQWAVLGDPNGQMTLLGVPLALSDGLAITLGI